MSYDWALFLLLRYHKTYRLIRNMRENPATTEKYSILQDFLQDLQDFAGFAEFCRMWHAYICAVKGF